MSKFIKINKLLFILLFLYSCGVGEALQGKKRSDQADEFLIDKKNPLSMPPDFDKLPEPGEAKSSIVNENNSEIKDLLLSDNENVGSTSKSNQSSSLETSIIEKIK